jgi:hypothetical protein
MGELLKQFVGRGGDQGKKHGTVLFDDVPSREEVAERAGITERQRKTAVRRPADEAAIEQPKPPTVTKCSEPG